MSSYRASALAPCMAYFQVFIIGLDQTVGACHTDYSQPKIFTYHPKPWNWCGVSNFLGVFIHYLLIVLIGGIRSCLTWDFCVTSNYILESNPRIVYSSYGCLQHSPKEVSFEHLPPDTASVANQRKLLQLHCQIKREAWRSRLDWKLVAVIVGIMGIVDAVSRDSTSILQPTQLINSPLDVTAFGVHIHYCRENKWEQSGPRGFVCLQYEITRENKEP